MVTTTAVRRGPRSGPDRHRTRDDILVAARRQFAELGYERATLRVIAAEAGVTPRLISHYFTSKQRLFVEALEIPFDVSVMFGGSSDLDPEQAGRHVATVVVGVLESERGRQTMIGVVRAAASEPEAAKLLRGVLLERLIGPIAAVLRVPDPELRAGLMASQVVGLVVTRYVVGLEPVAHCGPDRLVSILAPVFQHYLTADLEASDAPLSA